ncbi:MAG: hypothetical protein LBS25_09030 [Candidatus Symbiothrix sp.]|jgi:hypothetical protein|nr:hypothetical protein [Candidatus Symbiothrix sp.]
MKAFKKWTALWLFLSVCFGVSAQKGLHIDSIFRDYGKREGSTLIELAKDVLGNHTKINRYKSLIAVSDSLMFERTRQAVKADFIDHGSYGNRVIFKESLKDGQLVDAAYCLGKAKESADYEYILFSVKKQQMTLIYLRGKFPPLQLYNELEQLKNLFIEVNNKRIKL